MNSELILEGDFYSRACDKDCNKCVYSTYPYRCTKKEKRMSTVKIRAIEEKVDAIYAAIRDLDKRVSQLEQPAVEKTE